MKKKLTCESARTICIVKTLAKLGHFPTKKSEKEAWFLSPLRSESQASFIVSLNKNRWYDHGLGKGGNVIDLVVAMNHCTVKESLDLLSENKDFLFFRQQPLLASPEHKITVLRINDINHPALRNYLAERSIPLRIATKYCQEVWYRLNGKEYFALGLQNNNGGWELRNKYFKNSTSPKSYTLLGRSSERLLITEGMFDFLSLATLEEELVNTSDCIVLNSLSFINSVKEHIPNYPQIQLYLDNDPAGIKATTELLSLFDNSTDKRNSYKDYKDLNEKLKTERTQIK
jgi:hypothetical protein